MFTSAQYRATAAKYAELIKTAASADEKREFQELQKSFLTLAANTQWTADNRSKILQAVAAGTRQRQVVNLTDQAETVASDVVHDAAAIAIWNDEGGAPRTPGLRQQNESPQAPRDRQTAVRETDNEQADS
jgi:hypothetical protein